MSPAALLLSLPFLHAKSGAAPDSAAVAATALRHAIEGWHEFYLLAGTAAVTLVGLLFVALSFHLDTLLHDERAHLLAAARMAYLNFIFVLTLSLFFLIPDPPPRVLGLAVFVLSTVSLGYIAWNMYRARARRQLTRHEQFLRRRLGLAGFIFGIAVAASIGFLVEPGPGRMLQFMMLTIVTLVNAAGMSWDLLVQVGRMRKASGEAPKA
ncbi:MAG: hypothetical protein IT347_05860 [Candidatus Eisenbacteria bacterium]|nr:hypothetical protein [Candidatus Eisenbacteria bacterium]